MTKTDRNDRNDQKSGANPSNDGLVKIVKCMDACFYTVHWLVFCLFQKICCQFFCKTSDFTPPPKKRRRNKATTDLERGA